ADSRADCMDDRVDFFIFEYILKFRSFGVDHLTAERKNGLELPVPALFCRSAGGIPLDQIQFIFPGIPALCRSQLSGQECILASFIATPRFLACLPCRFRDFPCPAASLYELGSERSLLFEVVGKVIRHKRLHYISRFTRS